MCISCRSFELATMKKNGVKVLGQFIYSDVRSDEDSAHRAKSVRYHAKAYYTYTNCLKKLLLVLTKSARKTSFKLSKRIILLGDEDMPKEKAPMRRFLGPIASIISPKTAPYVRVLFRVLSRLGELHERQRQLATVITPLKVNPLLPLGGHDDWDSVYATWASVLHDGIYWRMYYSGKDKLGYIRVGLAFSEDRLNWTKHTTNPILDVGPAGTWDALFVYCPIVWKEKESWKMIFTGCDSPNNMHFQVGLAESLDGIGWTKFKGNPVFNSRHAWDLNRFQKHETEGWGLLFNDSEYYLFYNPVTRRPRQLGVALSHDLISWKSLFPQAVLPSEGFPWELRYMKYCAWPFKFGKYTYLLASTSDVNYTMSKIGLWRLVGSLPSVKGIEFLGYVLGTSAEWCERAVDTPFVVSNVSSDRFFCYYGGRSVRNEWTEGVALINKQELSK